MLPLYNCIWKRDVSSPQVLSDISQPVSFQSTWKMYTRISRERKYKVFSHQTWHYLLSRQASLPLYSIFPLCWIKLYLQLCFPILIIMTWRSKCGFASDSFPQHGSLGLYTTWKVGSNLAFFNTLEITFLLHGMNSLWALGLGPDYLQTHGATLLLLGMERWSKVIDWVRTH